ncbi:MAG: DNA mismatch repair endonuclease MutL [Firmicutes bacterium]|nr:DNA mismatch repair endonuclease MutL [Bacillota bacterium]
MIHLLDNSLINKIAAGEVVERPASVVKELAENSIDAGATRIEIEIESGGCSLIRVRDNGCGIPGDEVKNAFMRHATSKINSLEDLDNILTMGFRGEALSSIASVSQVETVTRTKESETAVKIRIEGGVVQEESETAANVGTDFAVRNIFYNTPARRKFLKKPATESGYISEIVNKIALGHPDIGIKYVNNGSLILQTMGNSDLRECVYHIYGRTVSDKMLPLDFEKEGYRIKGLIGKPEMSRGNRTYENFFINGRFIKSNLLSSAVEEAYKGKVMVGKFPVFVLNIMPVEGSVDVNVHPTKLEVRFSDENTVYDVVYAAVEKVLSSANLIPTVSWDRPEKKKEKATQITIDEGNDFVYSAQPVNYGYNAVAEGGNVPLSMGESVKTAEQGFTYDFKKSRAEVPLEETREDTPKSEPLIPVRSLKKVGVGDDTQNFSLPPVKPKDITEPVGFGEKEERPSRKPFFNAYTIVGRLFNTYWIVEQGEKMYMIDQHAAHERILFEEFSKKLKNHESVSQLIVPVDVRVSEKERQTIEDNRKLLEGFGFEFEYDGKKSYTLSALPYFFEKYDVTADFLEIVDAISERNINSIYDIKGDDIALMSCKAAVKGNRKLDPLQARELIRRLLELEEPFTCPHGRPTIIEMSKGEIEKKFGRIQE